METIWVKRVGDAMSFDFETELDRLPVPTCPAGPCRSRHRLITDALLLKWHLVHGGECAWDVALHLGGPTAGYNDAWVVRRLLHLVDVANGIAVADASPSPPILSPPLALESFEHPPPIELLGPLRPLLPLLVGPPSDDGADDGADDASDNGSIHRAQTPEKQLERNTHHCKNDNGEDEESEDEGESDGEGGKNGGGVYVPHGKRRRWRKCDDRKILQFVATNGLKWREAARHMGGARLGYSDDAVRNRLWRLLGYRSFDVDRTKNPSTLPVHTRWTPDEDAVLIQACDGAPTIKTFRYVATKLSRTVASVRLRAQRIL